MKFLFLSLAALAMCLSVGSTAPLNEVAVARAPLRASQIAPLDARAAASDDQDMNAVIHLPITHVLLFQFKTTADPTAVANLLKAVLAMKDNCVQTKANGKSKPYIKSVKGGRDNSPEGVQFGITHAFIMEFNSVSDRDYYVASDKEHHRLQKVVAPLIEKAQAIDFNAGVF